MVIVGVDHSSSLQFGSIISEKRLAEDSVIANCIKACESPSEEHIPTAEGGICNEEIASTETLDKGYMNYGCSHYRRRCQIRAPCCNEIFDCSHCHNEAKNSICIDQKLRHDMPHHLLEKVVCSLCHTEQEVQQVCGNCGVCMGRYYCGICKLYDDDISKEQYHCDGCGICRIGGSKNFFHCDKCECCYSVLLKSSHPCMEREMHQDCPVCFEIGKGFAKDALIGWFSGELAAANAIINALCTHLQEQESVNGGPDYGSVLREIHCRRLNWSPVLYMQNYYPIVGVIAELQKVAEKKREVVAVGAGTSAFKEEYVEKEKKVKGSDNACGKTVVDSPESGYTDSGSQELQIICLNHEECKFRQAQVKAFVAKEQVNRNMVNIVRGLKVYEDLFNEVETSKLRDFVNELRVKGNKSDIEPIPALLQSVINHLIQWKLIPENRKPDCCIINFYNEGQYSDPFLKPRSLEQPLFILLLSESIMTFGRKLLSDGKGNYTGALTLPLREGSLLVIGRESFDKASHAMCSSLNRRVIISFFRRSSTRSDTNGNFLHSMLAPVDPVAVGPGGTPRGGTGFFEPRGSSSFHFLPP